MESAGFPDIQFLVSPRYQSTESFRTVYFSLSASMAWQSKPIHNSSIMTNRGYFKRVDLKSILQYANDLIKLFFAKDSEYFHYCNGGLLGNMLESGECILYQ